MSKSQKQFMEVSPESIEFIIKMAKDMELDPILLIKAEPGGCSGIAYQMEFITEEEMEDGDFAMEFEGATLVIDGVSKGFLEGAKIGYIDDEENPGLSIDGPKDKKSEGEGGCGCNCRKGAC